MEYKKYVVMFEGVEVLVDATITVRAYTAERAEYEARKFLSNQLIWRCTDIDVA